MDNKSLTFLSRLVSKRIKRADIGKSGSCHLSRHTVATLMLENGADIRFIQQMLGHVSIGTTEIYTHVSVVKLKQIHEMTHPPCTGNSGGERSRRPRRKSCWRLWTWNQPMKTTNWNKYATGV